MKKIYEEPDVKFLALLCDVITSSYTTDQGYETGDDNKSEGEQNIPVDP